MLDARLLFDVRFRHGEEKKPEVHGAASAEELGAKGVHTHSSEEWHSEQEQLASEEHKEHKPAKP